MKIAIIGVACFCAGLFFGTNLLRNPDPIVLAWGLTKSEPGTLYQDSTCSDDAGRTWWAARKEADGNVTCWAADKPSPLVRWWRNK